MTSFCLALQFLTRIPIPFELKLSDQALGRSVLFYPLVGLLIGGILVAIANILSDIAGIEVQAALLLISWVLLTGGLHLDGLADCADAWAGGLGDKQRSLEIMKDPAAGPIAVVTLILVLLLKWSACVYILQTPMWLVLLIAPVLGRLAILALMLSTPNIRVQGLGEKLQQYLPKQAAMLILIAILAVCAWLISFSTMLVVFIVCMLIRQLASSRLGGVTGDVYGAAVELVEVAVLVTSTLSTLV